MWTKYLLKKNWGSFYGGFKTNIILPNFIGLGNGITRGFGTICGLFDPDAFSFDEELLKEKAENTKSPARFQKEIYTSNKKISDRTTPYKTKKLKKNKLKMKKHPQFDNQIQDTETNGKLDDFNFNRGKFHKKQHEF